MKTAEGALDGLLSFHLFRAHVQVNEEVAVLGTVFFVTTCQSRFDQGGLIAGEDRPLGEEHTLAGSCTGEACFRTLSTLHVQVHAIAPLIFLG